MIYPGGGGAHNWAPMSYNPNAGLVYLPYSAGTYNFVAAPEPNVNAGGGAHGLGQAGQKPRTTPMPIWGPTQEQLDAADCKRAIPRPTLSNG